MIQSVNIYRVSEILSGDVEGVFLVPRYQREYTWGKYEWEKMFDDLESNDYAYFLGSIICINQVTDALIVPELEIVDGQQRLLTLSLLFSAFYAVLQRHSDLNDNQRFELANLKRKLVLTKKGDLIRLKPQIQNFNQGDYYAVLSEIELAKFKKPHRAGNRKIFLAFRYFQYRLKLLLDQNNNQPSAIFEFLEKVYNACLVKIEVNSHSQAYILFESLNNRGIPLTAIDLIKNKLLARLEHVDPGKVDHHYECWTQFLEYLGDNYVVQERFFRQYYNAFKDEFIETIGVPIATRSNSVQIYEKLIDKDPSEFLQKISYAGEIYSQILCYGEENNYLNQQSETYQLFKALAHIRGAPSYLLLLHLLARKQDLGLNDSHIASITDYLIRFFVRRSLTDKPPTRDLIRFFMELVEEIKHLSGDEVIKKIKLQIMDESASDAEFKVKLQGNIYEENLGTTRFILCALAEQHMTKETWVNLWRYENKHFVWTIEHVFPQGENIPQCWIDMIAGGDKSLAIELQQQHVHKLGNLTISGFNSKLGNKCFLEKRDRKDPEGRTVGYKNGLKLNKELAQASSWSIAQITSRTAKMVEQVMNLFDLGLGNN